MPPPPETDPLPPARPRPKPKPPKPKPPKPKPAAVRDQTHGVAVPLPPDPFACAAHCSEACSFHGLCAPPPPSRTATVHLRSSRLPTPLIALSASVLAVSVLLLLVLLVCRVVRWRRRATAQQETPLNHHVVDEEAGPLALAPAPAEEDSDDGDGVHHVWYIKTVGLDERAIAAITALVYDADKCRAAGLGADGGCAVCLAEFRDGETLRLLPRCAHAFHRGCIDTWLRAHVNCPLCRAPVKVAASGNAADLGGEPVASLRMAAGHGGPAPAARDDDGPSREERALRRAASMVAMPRQAWPDVDSQRAPASNSAREGEMGLAKISRVLKLSEALEMAGIGARRSASFSAASSLRLPGRSGQPPAGANTDEITR